MYCWNKTLFILLFCFLIRCVDQPHRSQYSHQRQYSHHASYCLLAIVTPLVKVLRKGSGGPINWCNG